MADDKKWFPKGDKLDTGALTAQGWPDVGKVVANVKAGKTPYATTVQRIVAIMNVTKDPATKKKCQAALVRLKREAGSKPDMPMMDKKSMPMMPPKSPMPMMGKKY